MDLRTFEIKANCIFPDEVLFEHIRLALKRNLPLMQEYAKHEGTAILVGSGPSVETQLESIRKRKKEGYPIIAIKDAHDWLLENGIVPDYAVAVDPQEHRWNCFTRKNERVHYMIASQCHPAMFDHLDGMNVTLWHLYFKDGQTYPPDSLLVTGGTTTGLRAITLFYSQGYRKFELYGYDSCLQGNTLRITGKQHDKPPIEIYIGSSKKRFLTTAEMAAQANEFQMICTVMPGLEVTSHGEGVITTILEERAKFKKNDFASFIHSGGESAASFRYRARIPSEQLGTYVNNLWAKVVIFAKPTESDLDSAKVAKANGRKVIADFCDDHFDKPHYHEMAQLADAITCPTEAMAIRIEDMTGRKAKIIPDPFEYPLLAPHCRGVNLLWFGHGLNYPGLQKILPELESYPLRIVSNIPGTIMWAPEIMPAEFAQADIVIIPETQAYKSPNRAVEAIRQGCFVVAESHPSLYKAPVWIGNIKEGIEWARQNPQLANAMTLRAQEWAEQFSPERVANAWKTLIQELSSTSAADSSAGMDGLTSILPKGISPPICEASPSMTTMLT